MLTGRRLFGCDTPDDVLSRKLMDDPDFGMDRLRQGVKRLWRRLCSGTHCGYMDAYNFVLDLAGWTSQGRNKIIKKAKR